MSADDPREPSAPNVTLSDAVNEENPWPGLYQYTEKTSAYFHGRNEEVNTLLGMVRRRLLTVFYGQSGLGKSSLIQAGLFPKLRAEFFVPVYIRLGHDALAQTSKEMSLVEQTKLNIAAAIDLALRNGAVQAVEGIDPHPTPDETLWMYLHRRDLGLRTPGGNPAAPVLVFDQFEEIFTIGRSESKTRRESFLRDLADCVENRPPEEVLRTLYAETQGARPGKQVNLGAVEFQRQDYRIIFSLREDYLAELFDLSPMMPSLTENQIRLLPLDGWQALEAVSIPGERLVDPLVAREIIELVASRRRDSTVSDSTKTNFASEDEEADPALLKVDPSLLNMVCRELNAERQRRDEPKISKQIVGDMLKADRSILRDFYEQCLADLPSAASVRVFVEENLLTAEGYRGMVDLTNAREFLKKMRVESPQKVIDSLVNKRLLRTFKRVDEKTTWLELTHDVLCETVKTSRTERRVREETAAKEAEQKERVAFEMDREKRMRAEAEERELEARQRIRTMRKERRLTRIALVLGVGMLVVLLIAAVLFRNTWETGKQAKRNSQAISAKAWDERKSDPILGDVNALPYLSVALSLNRQDEKLATDTARLLLQNDWCLPVTPPFSFKPRNQRVPLVTASFTPDGKSIAAISRAGRLYLSHGPEFDEPEAIQLIGAPGEDVTVTGANFSSDGRRLLIAPYSLAGSVRADPSLAALQLWEWSDSGQGYVRSPLRINHSGTMRTASWSGDGRVLAVSPTQWDQPSVILVLKEGTYEALHTAPGTWIEISKDGTHFIVAGTDGMARIFDVSTLKPAKGIAEFSAVKSATESRIFGIGFNSDRTKVWVTSAREPMRIYDLATGGYTEILAKKANPLRVLQLPNFVDRFIVGVSNAALLCEGNYDRWRPMPADGGYVTPALNPAKPEVLTLSGESWLGTDTLQVWDIQDLPKVADADKVVCKGEVPVWFIKLIETLAGSRKNIYEIEKPMRLSEIAEKFANEPKKGGYQVVWDRFFGRRN